MCKIRFTTHVVCTKVNKRKKFFSILFACVVKFGNVILDGIESFESYLLENLEARLSPWELWSLTRRDRAKNEENEKENGKEDYLHITQRESRRRIGIFRSFTDVRNLTSWKAIYTALRTSNYFWMLKRRARALFLAVKWRDNEILGDFQARLFELTRRDQFSFGKRIFFFYLCHFHRALRIFYIEVVALKEKGEQKIFWKNRRKNNCNSASTFR